MSQWKSYSKFIFIKANNLLKYFFLLQTKSQIKIYDIIKNREHLIFENGHNDPITCIVFSPKGYLIASSS